ncbi:hypothetical protein RSAG8_06392, partial [Rhizoctonia solani AG-8 WAC10335]
MNLVFDKPDRRVEFGSGLAADGPYVLSFDIRSTSLDGVGPVSKSAFNLAMNLSSPIEGSAVIYVPM